MTKILTVAKPYAWMEPGETFELSNDGTMYTNTYTDEYSSVDKDTNYSSKVKTEYSISLDVAKSLLDKKILVENKSDDFKNIFDEIDTMLDTYQADLDNIDKDMKNDPACMKVEKETVLRNMIKTLSYLKSLKK